MRERIPMKLVLAVPLLALLIGCGATKSPDPLAGLAGPTDPSLYGFETDTQGWTKPLAPSSSTYQVLHSPGTSFYGSACMALAVQQMSNIDGTAGLVSKIFGVPVDLSGKTVTAWYYAPTNAQPSESIPTYAQLYMKDGAGKYANSPGVNMKGETWLQIVFSPVANNTGADINSNGYYYDNGFNPSTIGELGIKIAVNGSAPASFAFDGTFLIDSIHW